MNEKIRILKEDERGIIYEFDNFVAVIWKEGSKSSNHTHETAETVCVLKGRLKIIIDNNEHILESTERLSIQPNINRQIEALEDVIFLEFR